MLMLNSPRLWFKFKHKLLVMRTQITVIEWQKAFTSDVELDFES